VDPLTCANRVAGSLMQQGVQAGDIFALCFDRGISQIVGFLAVLKAGGTFVPLDPDDPTFRMELMIAECGVLVNH
jgi:non-ribosomal peptide synthetase component F